MPHRSLEQLIDFLVDTLSPHVPPERIEQVVAACVEYAGDSGERAPGEQVIITAFGCDRPGILATITRVLYEAGVNILDVSQKILQEYFTLIMIADIGQMRPTLKELQEQLTRATEPLGIRIFVQHAEIFNAMYRP